MPAPQGPISIVLFQSIVILSQGGKGKDIVQVLFFHSTQANPDVSRAHGLRSQAVSDSFMSYLKVSLHLSALNVVLCDCNRLLY